LRDSFTPPFSRFIVWGRPLLAFPFPPPILLCQFVPMIRFFFFVPFFPFFSPCENGGFFFLFPTPSELSRGDFFIQIFLIFRVYFRFSPPLSPLGYFHLFHLAFCGANGEAFIRNVFIYSPFGFLVRVPAVELHSP